MESVSENKENQARGCLKLNDKIYPIYEGHNTVGRNPDAVINIKNLNVSKHHALITIIDENSHYISDFKSSNGTFLDSKKLTPLQLYKLNDGASIKFGDVFCTYKILDNGGIIRRSPEDSQQYSESLYGACTQEVSLPNLPDGINFNEMPTQVFRPTDLSINEMPTQVYNFSDHDNSSNDSIDFATMKKASESQALCKSIEESKVANDTSQNMNVESDTDDDLVPTPPVLNDKISEDDQISSTASSQIQPLNINSKKIVDSDIEDEAPCSQIQPVKTGKKNVIDSDSSDSDTEEYAGLQNNKSKYHISDDSETDIEGDEKNNEKSRNDTDLAPTTQNDKKESEDTSVNDLNLQLSESLECGEEAKFEEPKKIKKKLLPPDHIYCQSFTETQNTQGFSDLDPQVSESQNQRENREGMDAASGEITESSVNEDLENAKNEELDDSLDQLLEKDTPNEGTPSLPLVEQQDQQDKEVEKSTELRIPELHSKEDVGPKDTENDIFDQPTQTLDLLDDGKQDLTGSVKKDESCLNSTSKEDEMFLLPTQVLEGGNESQKVSKSSISEDKDDDMFLQPTQAMEQLYGEDKLENSVKNDDLSLSKTEEDSPTTQALQSLLTEDNIESAPPEDRTILKENEDQPDKIVVMEKSLTSKNEEDDNLFLPPTQALERLLSDDKAQSNENPEPKSPGDDVFLAPKQFRTSSPLKKVSRGQNLPEKTTEEDDDSFILQPTQALEVMHKEEAHFNKVEDQLHEIFASQSLMCTQQLVDVLEVSRNDDIIDDSIIQEKEKSLVLPSLGFVKAQPISAESVKEILGEGLRLENEDKIDVTELRTYSRKKDVSQEKEGKIEDDVKNGTDNANKGESRRRGRSKKKLATGGQASAEDVPKTSKHENIDDKKRTIRSRNDDQELVVSDEKNTKDSEDKKKNEESRRGNRRKQNLTASDDSQISLDKEESKLTKDGAGDTRTKRKQSISASKSENSTSATSKEEEIKKGRGRRKQDDLSDKRELRNESTRNSSQNKPTVEENLKEKEESQSNETRGRGRRKQTLINSDDQNPNSESKEDKSQSSTKDDGEENKRKGRKKRVVSTTQDKASEETEKNKSESDRNEEKVKKGKGRQNLTPLQVEDKDDSQSSTDDSERSKRRNRRNQNIALSSEMKENVKTRSQRTDEKDTTPKIDVNEGRSKRTKRKKDENDETDETPTTKKATNEETTNSPKKETTSASVSRKRASDSEDDFVTKVPKITPIRKPPTRLRKPRKLDESNDDVISVSSTSSKPETIISISSTSTIEDAGKKTRRLSANSKRQKKEAEEEKNKQNRNISMLATPERSRRVSKPKVVFTMMDDPELESVIRQLGGSVVDTVDASTVLVTESVKRSLKLLCAVAQAKPICSPEWIHECKRKFAFVDPWEYILVDREAEKKWNFSLRESLNRSVKAKLLEDYTFQIIVNNAADVLKGAIEACGGKCVTRNLPKCDTDHLVIVSSENNRSKFSKIVKQNPKILVVEAEAIFDGTLRQEFKFNDYLIT